MDTSVLGNYDPAGFYCEMLHGDSNEPIRRRLAGLFDQGVTFTVIPRGHDATDVALTTNFGSAALAGFKVVTDEVAQ